MGHNDKPTTAATFQSNMKSYVTQAKAAGVNIVHITPIVRAGYTLAQEHGNSAGANLPQIIRDLGKSENVHVIDLTVTTWNWLQTITPKDYFAADSSASGGYDDTHLAPKGGDAVADFVCDAIKANPGIPPWWRTCGSGRRPREPAPGKVLPGRETSIHVDRTLLRTKTATESA